LAERIQEASVEIRDGFIVGIFNYCDSWCQRCAFTSRCRVFADMAELEARLDPQLAAIANAPPLPHEVEPEPPKWMQELIDEMNESCRNPPSADDWEREPRVAPEQLPVTARAKDYALGTHRWLTPNRFPSTAGSDEALQVIGWFSFLIGAKVNRALAAWPDEDPCLVTSDADGSAKVALIGIDRSHAAWLDLVERGVIPAGEAQSFIADLVWLRGALERARPGARRFVRPRFDEPDAMARLPVGE